MFHITGIPEKSDPKAHRALSAELDQACDSGIRNLRFKITIPIRRNRWREALGWLRVAYLYAFPALGYNFILRPELDPIREQLRNPDERITLGIIKHARRVTGDDGIYFVYWPFELHSVLVRLGCNLIFFPAFKDASTFYERPASHPESPHTTTLSGTHIDLPRKPEFYFDYEPALMWLTVPPEERGKQAS
jgi:hypothetical protein